MNCLFSVDLMPIDVRINMFLNKTPTNNFPFASFPLVQFLLIILSVKVTYISNEGLPLVAYSQGRAPASSRAHLMVIEFGPSLANLSNYQPTQFQPVGLCKKSTGNHPCSNPHIGKRLVFVKSTVIPTMCLKILRLERGWFLKNQPSLKL